jgi:hypothetical protein
MEDFVRVANKGFRNAEVTSDEWPVASVGNAAAGRPTPLHQEIAELFAND